MGKVSTDFFGDADSALDMVIQPDGRIVAAGSARNADSNVDFASRDTTAMEAWTLASARPARSPPIS